MMDELTQELEQIEAAMQEVRDDIECAERRLRSLEEEHREVKRKIALKAPPSDWPDMTPERARGWWETPAG